ncbi:hypothetical protein OYC64_000849 [Pagothenia borchgrevinki]|uniref:Uncharacterized protein n=1 Tax=Pagothenia borchgrevinki TaxID=8213 RepID=A0ABD2HFR9_PAGBO
MGKKKSQNLSFSLSLSLQYTGPIPGERGGELAMGGGRSETSALSGTAGGAGHDHYPEFPTAKRLLLLLVLLLQLLME